MYKLIIADDEEIIRESLAKLINWEELGFEIVGSLEDGSDVIELLNNMPVDVVLTDIYMNHMSGIDVARFVKEEQILCKIVFISAHREFDLAFQGIKYGVEDYILKPTKPAEVKKVFGKIKEDLDQKRHNVEQQRIVEARWKELAPVLREKFIGNLILGAFDNRKLLEQQWQLLYPQIDLYKCPCVLADLEIVDYQTFLNSEWHYGIEQFEDALYNYVRLFEGISAFHIVYKNKGSLKIFGIMKEHYEDVYENKVLCNNQLQYFVSQLCDFFKFHIIAETRKAFDNVYEIIEKQDDVIGRDIKSGHVEIYFYEQKKMILTNLMSGNIGMAQKVMQSIIKSMSDEDIRYRRHLLADVFSSISEFLWENNRQLFHKVQPAILFRDVLNMTSQKEIEDYCEYVFESMKNREAISDCFDQGNLVNQVKNYVREHVFEDVSLENVANVVFLSRSHFSRLFKKQTGENYIQFITRMKMEKAIELLGDPKYRVYQVGECLGYKTTRHFSRLFYGFTGYYPNQYRKEVLGIGDGVDGD